MQRKEDEKPSPVHLANRRHWNERWSELWDNARGWRIATYMSLATTAGAIAWVCHQTTEMKYAPPFIVEVDHIGESVAQYRMEQSSEHDPRVIKAALSQWIWDMRSVYADQVAQTDHFNHAYPMVDKDSAADTEFQRWFFANSDREQAKEDTVTVTIETVSPESNNPTSWRVNWTEQKKDLKGNLDGLPTYHYAIMGLKFKDQRTDSDILANPLGLFIHTLEWADRPAGHV